MKRKASFPKKSSKKKKKKLKNATMNKRRSKLRSSVIEYLRKLPGKATTRYPLFVLHNKINPTNRIQTDNDRDPPYELFYCRYHDSDDGIRGDEFNEDLSDLDDKLFIPDVEPRNSSLSKCIRTQIRKLTYSQLGGLVKSYWDLSRLTGKEKPSELNRKERADWVYDVLYDKIPDINKREIEKENIKLNAFSQENNFFEWLDITIPWDVMSEIFKFLPQSLETLNSFGIINEKHYLFCLRNWAVVKLNRRNLYKIPVMVLQFAREVHTALSGGITGKEVSYLRENLKGARKLVATLSGCMKFIQTAKDDFLDGVTCLDIGYQASSSSSSIKSHKIDKKFRNLRSLKICDSHKSFQKSIFVSKDYSRADTNVFSKLRVLHLVFRGETKKKWFQIPTHFRNLKLSSFSYDALRSKKKKKNFGDHLSDQSFKNMQSWNLTSVHIPIDQKDGKIDEKVIPFLQSQMDLECLTVEFYCSGESTSDYRKDLFSLLVPSLRSPKLRELFVRYKLGMTSADDAKGDLRILENEGNSGIQKIVIERKWRGWKNAIWRFLKNELSSRFINKISIIVPSK